MPANVNNQNQGMVPIGEFVAVTAGTSVLVTIPDNATGIYFQYRSGTGNYIWGETALDEAVNRGFRGNTDQEIRLDLYPGCPVWFSATGGTQITYLFFVAIDSKSLISRNR